MNPNGFTIVPNVVYDALERGVITSEMSDCLSLLYRWREHDSNVVREVSAERLKKWLSLLRPEYSAAEKKWPTAETIRRWMRGMLEAGWFTRDYEAGVERPYNVYLRNLGGYHVNFVEHVQGRPEGCAQLEKEELAQNDVNISEIKHWKQLALFKDELKRARPYQTKHVGEHVLLQLIRTLKTSVLLRLTPLGSALLPLREPAISRLIFSPPPPPLGERLRRRLGRDSQGQHRQAKEGS